MYEKASQGLYPVGIGPSRVESPAGARNKFFPSKIENEGVGGIGRNIMLGKALDIIHS